MYAKFGDESKLRKNDLMQEQLKVQTAVLPRALNIYHMPRGVNTYLSMTLYLDTYIKIVKIDYQMRLREAHIFYNPIAASWSGHTQNSQLLCGTYPSLYILINPILSSIPCRKFHSPCIVNRKPLDLCRAMHKYHSLYH